MMVNTDQERRERGRTCTSAEQLEGHLIEELAYFRSDCNSNASVTSFFNRRDQRKRTSTSNTAHSRGDDRQRAILNMYSRNERRT